MLSRIFDLFHMSSNYASRLWAFGPLSPSLSSIHVELKPETTGFRATIAPLKPFQGNLFSSLKEKMDFRKKPLNKTNCKWYSLLSPINVFDAFNCTNYFSRHKSLTLFNYLKLTSSTLKPCSVDEQVESIILVLILVDQLFLVRLEVVVD